MKFRLYLIPKIIRGVNPVRVSAALVSCLESINGLLLFFHTYGMLAYYPTGVFCHVGGLISLLGRDPKRIKVQDK